jgi:heme oxygenase
MLHEILKEATRSRHEELEKWMFVDEIMNGSLSMEQYKTILSTNYQVHALLEDRLFGAADQHTAERLDLAQRRKLPALLLDLGEASMDPRELTRNPENIPFRSPDGNFDNAAVLGALYVLEGATLGGNVIVRQLKENPALNILPLGFHYYRVYGADLIPYWKTFCALLNEQIPSVWPAAKAGAMELFRLIIDLQRNNRGIFPN